ncbi:MAG: hypothetical protein KJ958_04605 [Gammaproteobacteria bacterium]|nr:hypothetical protein [Gammaproteobacteria bacterium]MBU1978434.1 hypothetical protein [Gammaproteobacteria bacterium]
MTNVSVISKTSEKISQYRHVPVENVALRDEARHSVDSKVKIILEVDGWKSGLCGWRA